MATLADVLTRMPIFDNSLKTGSGEADEARAIIACNIAKDMFDTMAATKPRVMQSTINVATAAATETTTITATLMRLDALWLLDASGVVIRKLKRIEEVGGHIPSLPWPLQLTLASGQGTPAGYYASGSNFYWLPLPDGTNNVRAYGYVSAADFVTRASTFTYPAQSRNAFAAMAVKVLKTSTDDDQTALDALASNIYGPLFKSLKNFDRSEPHGRYYGETHDT